MNLELQGKVILLVGGSAGIGAATARLLVDEGARLALVARRGPELERLAAGLRSAGGEVRIYQGDAAQPGFLEGVVSDVATVQFGGLHGLVVVAGSKGPRGSVVTLTDEDWNYYFRQSTMVAVRACQTAIPELLKHANGAIVLTSAYSIHAQKPELLAYTAMKSTVAAISKNLAKTYGRYGLRVNCIAPGIIDWDHEQRAPLAERLGVSADRVRYESVRREFGMQVALERAGRQDEFADLIGYLLSARASYVTGALVNIDGGTDF